MNRKTVGALGTAIVLTTPWTSNWMLSASHAPRTALTVATSGIAILGASFLLTWAAETAEKDVPRAFAIAVLAVLAVAPEYAVDALYAWNAGVYADTPRGVEAGNLAVANMTGANRILVGVGWAGIALFTILRTGGSSDPAVREREGFLADAVVLDRDIGLEIVFLLGATLWAFAVPLGRGIDVVDLVVLVGIYVAYLAVVLRGGSGSTSTEEHVGVPATLQKVSHPYRGIAVLLLFVYSGLVIFTAVEPFAHGLEWFGTRAGIPPFFMIQWVAPLASESPELVVVAVLVTKARSTAGFSALVSSKLNQWTLLIGTLVAVYSLALGQYGALPFDQKQAGEIWLTAAQSFFALALIVDFEISIREAIGLFLLFISQVTSEFLLVQDAIHLPVTDYQLLLLFSAVYIALGTVLFWSRRKAVARLANQTGSVVTRTLLTDTRSNSAD